MFYDPGRGQNPFTLKSMLILQNNQKLPPGVETGLPLNQRSDSNNKSPSLKTDIVVSFEAVFLCASVSYHLDALRKAGSYLRSAYRLDLICYTA